MKKLIFIILFLAISYNGYGWTNWGGGTGVSSWDELTDIPSGFSDDVDNDTWATDKTSYDSNNDGAVNYAHGLVSIINFDTGHIAFTYIGDTLYWSFDYPIYIAKDGNVFIFDLIDNDGELYTTNDLRLNPATGIITQKCTSVPYIPNNTVIRALPSLKNLQFKIDEPDARDTADNDGEPIWLCDNDSYPNGIKIEKMKIELPAATTTTIVVLDFASKRASPTIIGTFSSISSESNYIDLSYTLDAGHYIGFNFDNADLADIQCILNYYIIE